MVCIDYLLHTLQHFEDYRKLMFSNPPDVPPSVHKRPSHDSVAFTGSAAAPKLFWPLPGEVCTNSWHNEPCWLKLHAQTCCWHCKERKQPARLRHEQLSLPMGPKSSVSVQISHLIRDIVNVVFVSHSGYCDSTAVGVL